MIRNENCTYCKMHAGCKVVCNMSQDQTHRPIMIVGEYPSYQDAAYGTQLSNNTLDSVIKNVLGIDPALVYKTYMVKCRSGADIIPGAGELDSCMPYLDAEIAAVKPKVIITLGEQASHVFTGSSGITGIRGKVFERNGWVDEDGKLGTVKVIPTFSPTYAERSERGLKEFALDIQKAYHIAIDYKSEGKRTKVVMVDTIAKFDQLMDSVEEAGYAAFDYETASRDQKDKEGALKYWTKDFFVTVLSMTFAPGIGYLIPLWHTEPTYDEKGKYSGHLDPIFSEEELAYIVAELERRYFNNVKVLKIAHNAKYDIHVSKRIGIKKFRGRLFDTMVAHSLLFGGDPHDLKTVGSGLYPDYAGYEDEVKKFGWDKIPMSKLSLYACTDTDLTFRIRITLEQMMLEDEPTYVLFRNLSIPLLWSLEDAEYGGMQIDTNLAIDFIKRGDEMAKLQEDKLRAYKQIKRFEAAERALAIEDEVKKQEDKIAEYNIKYPDKETAHHKRAREAIASIRSGAKVIYTGVNFGSPAQLSKLMYGENGFKFPMKRDRKTGALLSGTGKDVVVDIDDDTGFIADLQKWRSMTKMLSTYLRAIYEAVDDAGYLHAQLKQHTVITGRLSSSDPNLQNLPNKEKVKDEETKKLVSFVKEMFSVPKGFTFVGVDFSQAELRVIAHYANEKAMLKAYAEDRDLHIVTAAGVLGISYDEFKALPEKEYKMHRGNAKPVNFGYVYGQGWEGFQQFAKVQYGIHFTNEQAKDLRDGYFKTYPALLDYHELYKQKAHRFKYVRTMFGRKVPCKDIDSPDNFLRSNAERSAINAPIQGTAGEWTEFAIVLLMYRLQGWSERRVLFKNTVHDAIYFYIPDEMLEHALRIIKLTCEEPPILDYFGRSMDDVKMKIDAEVSVTGWKNMETRENIII